MHNTNKASSDITPAYQVALARNQQNSQYEEYQLERTEHFLTVVIAIKISHTEHVSAFLFILGFT